jgi:aminoglycoside phosphotransferase (APT) family kinase protein
VTSYEIRGLRDEPGFHWANPGIKEVTVHLGDTQHAMVLKSLTEQSRREVLVYRFLDQQQGFPSPRLYDSGYDEDGRDFWIVTERCVGKDCGGTAGFHHEIGILLARIHAAFWNRTDALPSLFHQPRGDGGMAAALGRLRKFVQALTRDQSGQLDDDLNGVFAALVAAQKGMEPEYPGTDSRAPRCLIHGAFHPPEIMWRERSGRYDPVGVDWESSYAGQPEEDFAAVSGKLFSREDEVSLQALYDAYGSEMKHREICVDVKALRLAVRRLAVVHMLGTTIPFVAQQYLRKAGDSDFSKWLVWAKEELSHSVRFVTREITRAGISD